MISVVQMFKSVDLYYTKEEEVWSEKTRHSEEETEDDCVESSPG